MTGFRVGTAPCRCGQPRHETRLVAITGGPGAGKTAVLQMALQVFCTHVGVLPEAAGIVFGGGFPRYPDDLARRAAQRAIFRVQREIETIVLGEGHVAVGLCDRGTIDGLAYWPDSAASYWKEVGSSLDAELARYAAVIHLRTPPASQGYNHANTLRVESPGAAHEIDRRIEDAWASHPRRLVVPSEDDFLYKAARALAYLRDQLPPCCHQHPIPTPPSAPWA